MDYNYSQQPYRRLFKDQYNPNQEQNFIPDAFQPQPINPEDIQSPVPPVVRPQVNPWKDQFDRIYSNPSPASEQYAQHYNSMPTREQYSAGKLSKIGAVLAGISTGWQRGAGAGVEAARNITEGPYRNAMQDWSNRGQGLGVRADLEDKNTQRQIAYVKALIEQADKDEARKLQERGVIVSERGANLRDIEYQNPNLSFGDVGGQAVARNPRTGAIVNNLGESSGAFSARMGDVYSTRRQGDQQRFTAEQNAIGRTFTGEQNNLNREQTRTQGELNRTSREQTARSNQRPASPEMQASALAEAKKRVQMADPFNYSKVFDPATGGLLPGADQVIADQVRNKIYAQYNLIMQGQNYNPGQTPNTTQPKTIDLGVIDPNKK
jgi:hypothetical protein